MNKLLTPQDLAIQTGLALQTIYNRHSNGGSLPRCINTGRLIRFRPSDVDEWLSMQYEDCLAYNIQLKPEILQSRRRGRPTKAEQIRRRNQSQIRIEP